MMALCDPPTLGRKLANAFQSVRFDKTDKFSIRQTRQVMHAPYARVLSASANYVQQLDIHRTLNGADLGPVFNFGGESDAGKTPAGKTPAGWHKFTKPITLPLNYIFTALSWYSGCSRGASGFELSGSIHEHGIHFRVGTDDAGHWAHGGAPDGDFKDYIMEFVLLIPGQPNWLIQIQQTGIVIL